MARILVAGIGNIFLGDDGFGPEVLRNLAATGEVRSPSGEVRLTDYGIRGMHLAYDLLDPWDGLVMVDAIPPRGQPGAVHVMQVRSADVAALRAGAGQLDAHGMDPASVLANLEALGGALPPTFLVGCEADCVDEGIGLSPPVAAAVAPAAAAVRTLLADLAATPGHLSAKGE